MTTPSSKQKTNSQLNLKTKLYQESVVKRVQDIDWKNGSEAPMVVEFDPTTACNLACPDCISRDLLNKGFFSRTRIHELTKEIVDAGVKAVILIGGGEPLAHPEIGWVIEYLGKHNVQIGLTTNGILMHRYMDVIAKYVNWVRVSMDSGSTETYNKIRPSVSGKSEFHNAIKNMRALAKIKTGKLGYSFMIYSEGKFDTSKPLKTNNDVEESVFLASELIKSLHSDEFSNAHEIYMAAELAKDIGCDYFEIKPMYDINHFAIEQRKDLIETVEDQIEKSDKLETENFRVLRATKLKNTLSGEGSLEPKDYTRCAVAQMRTLVTPSGVYVCPYFRGREDKNIGDVKKSSFKEMWKGEAREKVMNKLNPSVDCKMHCIRHESNLIIEDMINSDANVETSKDFDFFI